MFEIDWRERCSTEVVLWMSAVLVSILWPCWCNNLYLVVPSMQLLSIARFFLCSQGQSLDISLKAEERWVGTSKISKMRKGLNSHRELSDYPCCSGKVCCLNQTLGTDKRENLLDYFSFHINDYSFSRHYLLDWCHSCWNMNNIFCFPNT